MTKTETYSEEFLDAVEAFERVTEEYSKDELTALLANQDEDNTQSQWEIV